MNGASIAPPTLLGRWAMLVTAAPAAGLPVDELRGTIQMPDQKLPPVRYQFEPSTTSCGSIMLNALPAADEMTRPLSVHEPGRPVVDCAMKMPDFCDPNDEAA